MYVPAHINECGIYIQVLVYILVCVYIYMYTCTLYLVYIQTTVWEDWKWPCIFPANHVWLPAGKGLYTSAAVINDMHLPWDPRANCPTARDLRFCRWKRTRCYYLAILVVLVSSATGSAVFTGCLKRSNMMGDPEESPPQNKLVISIDIPCKIALDLNLHETETPNWYLSICQMKVN